MIALIGEITSSLQMEEDTYGLSFCGIVEPADILSESGLTTKIVTKLSNDAQGDIQKELLLENKWSEDSLIVRSPLLSSVMIDYDMRLKGTAPASITHEDLLPIIEKLKAEWIVLTESIMSTEPAATAIAEALSSLSAKPKVVIYSNAVWPHIESLETLKKSIDAMSENLSVYTMSEAVDSKNAIKIEREHFVDLFK